MPITYQEGDIRINPETKQVERLTPEGIWSAQALEQQVKGIQSEVQRLSKEATILDTSRLREEVIPKIKTDLQNLEGQGGTQVSGQPEESITLYRGTSSQQIPKSQVGDMISKGWGTQQPTAGGLSKEEKTALGVETAEDTQAKQLQTDIDKIDTAVETYNTSLNGLLTSMTDQTADLVKTIQQQYEVRRQQLKRITQSQTQSYQTAFMRSGTTRYASMIAEGVVSEIEQQGVMKLAELDADERSAIAQAKSALTNKQFDIAKEQVSTALKLRDDKQSQLNELNKEIRKRNATLAEQERIMNRDLAIGKLVEAGIKDPFEIQNQLYLSGITANIDEIDNVLGALPEKEEEKFQVIDNIPYRVQRDESGNITGFEKIEGVEKEEDIKWSDGQPYRAVKDEKGNVLKYEKIPGVVEKPIKPKATEPLSILDIQRYGEIYPDAGIVAGDTETTAIQKVLQTITPRDFSDDELRSLINEVKTGNKTYDEALTAINSVAQIKNKDRAIAIANEIYAKKQGNTGQAFSETVQGLKIIAGETGQQIFDFLFKSQRNK